MTRLEVFFIDKAPPQPPINVVNFHIREVDWFSTYSTAIEPLVIRWVFFDPLLTDF